MQLTAHLYDLKSVEQINFDIKMTMLKKQTYGQDVLEKIKNQIANEKRKMEGKNTIKWSSHVGLNIYQALLQNI